MCRGPRIKNERDKLRFYTIISNYTSRHANPPPLPSISHTHFLGSLVFGHFGTLDSVLSTSLLKVNQNAQQLNIFSGFFVQGKFSFNLNIEPKSI